MQRQHQGAGGLRLAPRLIEFRQHRSNALEPGLDRLLRPAARLDRQGPERVALDDLYSSFIRPIWNTSQPRPTMSVAPTFGLAA